MRRAITAVIVVLLGCLTLAAHASAYYVDGLYYGYAKGFGGDVTVKITIQSGRITAVTAEGPNETKGVGSRALEQLPAKILAANGVQGVDTIAGATFTSRAVLKAAEQCLELAKAGVESTPTPTPSPTPTPTPTPPPAISHSEYNDGVFSSQSDDFSGKVSVQLTIVNGWIVDAVAEGNSIVGAAALSDLPRQIMAMNGVDHVDAIAGATITSKAILEAATQCLALSENAANSVYKGVIRIPPNVQLISSEAFSNISAEIIIIPSSCKQLMKCSFSDIQTLRWIWIPSSVENIADDAFAGCDLLCICTTQDSAAHKHAEKHGIKYRIFPE